jgi:Ser/Thr protein kinase RdoA (MazF antagonist)
VTDPAPDTDRLELIARDALAAYGLPARTGLTLLNISENATFQVDDPDTGRRSVLRVHRPGYHTPVAIRSELAWVQALRAAGAVSTPAVLPADDGSLVAAGTHPDGERRIVVRFAWVDGVEPAGDRLVDDFLTLGAIAARLHAHARTWRRPPGFTRFRWDYETSVGRRGTGVAGRTDRASGRRARRPGPSGRRAAEQPDRLRWRPDRFGLMRADMRLANLLVDRRRGGGRRGPGDRLR